MVFLLLFNPPSTHTAMNDRHHKFLCNCMHRRPLLPINTPSSLTLPFVCMRTLRHKYALHPHRMSLEHMRLYATKECVTLSSALTQRHMPPSPPAVGKHHAPQGLRGPCRRGPSALGLPHALLFPPRQCLNINNATVVQHSGPGWNRAPCPIGSNPPLHTPALPLIRRHVCCVAVLL